MGIHTVLMGLECLLHNRYQKMEEQVSFLAGAIMFIRCIQYTY